MGLIAKVTVRAWKGDAQVVVEPGDPVPDDLLSAHDREQLLAMGSIVDEAEEAAAAKAAEKDGAKAGAEFKAAQKAVKAAAASTAPEGAGKK